MQLGALLALAAASALLPLWLVAVRVPRRTAQRG